MFEVIKPCLIPKNKLNLEHANKRDINDTQPRAGSCKFARSLQFECAKLTFNFLVSLISSRATAALYRANLNFILSVSMNQSCIFLNVCFRTASVIKSLRYWANWQGLSDFCTANSRLSYSWTKSNLRSTVRLFHSCRKNRDSSPTLFDKICHSKKKKLRRIKILFVGSTIVVSPLDGHLFPLLSFCCVQGSN